MSCVTPGRLLGAWPVPPAPQGPRLSPLPTLFPQQRTLALSMTQLGPESPSESSKQGCSRGPPRTTVSNFSNEQSRRVQVDWHSEF